MTNAMANGVIGGITSVLQGGKFGHGFASAGVSAFAKPGIRKYIGIEKSGLPSRVIVRAVLGGTLSKATGGKFANGASTAAFSQLFNDEQTLARERAYNEQLAAQKRLRDRWVARRLNTTFSVDGDAHEYRVRGLICSTSSAGCNSDYADRVYGHVNRNDIPFTNDDLRAGLHSLQPVPFSSPDPIVHTQSLDLRTSVNVTLEGHQFHPGTVTHRVHFEGGNLYYDLIGVGTGNNAMFNNWIGIRLFGPGVSSVVREYGY
jgi:hypothetical protein